MTSESNIDDGDPSLDSIIVLLLSSDSSDFFELSLEGTENIPLLKALNSTYFPLRSTNALL